MADHGVIPPGRSVDTTSVKLALDARRHVKLGKEKVYDVSRAATAFARLSSRFFLDRSLQSISRAMIRQRTMLGIWTSSKLSAAPLALQPAQRS